MECVGAGGECAAAGKSATRHGEGVNSVCESGDAELTTGEGDAGGIRKNIVGAEGERAGVDGGGAGVGIRSIEGKCAHTVFGESKAAAGNDAADGEGAGGDGHRASGVHGHGAGAEVEVVGAEECEIAAPGLGVVVGEGDSPAGGVVERAADNREGAAARSGGVVEVQAAIGKTNATREGIGSREGDGACGGFVGGDGTAEDGGGVAALKGVGAGAREDPRGAGDVAASEGHGAHGIGVRAEAERAAVDGDGSAGEGICGIAKDQCAVVEGGAAGVGAGCVEGKRAGAVFGDGTAACGAAPDNKVDVEVGAGANLKDASGIIEVHARSPTARIFDAGSAGTVDRDSAAQTDDIVVFCGTAVIQRCVSKSQCANGGELPPPRCNGKVPTANG